MDRDIFLVFKQLIGIQPASEPQVMGAYYKHDSAQKQADKIKISLGVNVNTWVERTKLSR